MKNNVLKSVFAAAALSISTSSFAGLIDISVDNVGSIQSIEDLSPEASAGFLVGESLSLRFTFNDATALTSSTGVVPSDDAFIDTNAQLWLTGLTSGATLEYFSGLIIEVDNQHEFEIESIATSATQEFTQIIGGDIDWDTLGTNVFSDITSISTVFSELLANPFNNQSTNTASTRFWLNGSSHYGMEFGHVPSVSNFSSTNISTVSEPTTFVVFGLGLMALFLRKRKVN